MPRISTKNRATRKSPTGLRSLPILDEVKKRLVAGWTLDQVAHYIQNDERLLLDVSVDTVKSQLQRLRQTLPPADYMTTLSQDNQVDQKLRPFHKKVVEEIDKGLDEVKELERLYQLQMDRIEIDATTEKKNKKLFPSMNQEIRVAKELLESSSRLKMDLGIDKRHLGVVETEHRLLADVNARYGSAASIVLEDAQARQRLMGASAALDRFLLSAGEGDREALSQALDAVADEAIIDVESYETTSYDDADLQGTTESLEENEAP